jgi:thiol:disulfide interchange protein
MMHSFIKATMFLLSLSSVNAYSVQKPAQIQFEVANSRRALFRNIAAVAVGGVIASVDASPALASGGATAGKYT